jgi:hypothetical protein
VSVEDVGMDIVITLVKINTPDWNTVRFINLTFSSLLFSDLASHSVERGQSGQDKSNSIQDQLYPNEQGWYTALRPENTQTTLVDATFAAPSASKTTSPRPERPFTREESQEVMRQLLEWTDDELIRLPAGLRNKT